MTLTPTNLARGKRVEHVCASTDPARGKRVEHMSGSIDPVRGKCVEHVCTFRTVLTFSP